MATAATNDRLEHAEQTGLPVVSTHAYRKWSERMPDAATDPETALENAHGLQEICLHGHWQRDPDPPDTVWVYRGILDERAYTAALIERSGCITTVLRASKMAHKPMAAYLRTAARCRGGYHE